MLRLISCLLPVVLVLPGCIKRIPATAGGDRQLVAGEAAHFGRQTEVPDGTQVRWNMGEGTELSGARVTHAWHSPGSYQVKVLIEDSDGKRREDTAKIQVTRPPLMQVLPADTEVLVLLDQPSRRLAEFPLFLERLLVSGQDANAALAKMRDLLGFDPLEEKGLRSAGLDPQGGIAGVSRQIGGKPAFAIVYPVADAELARQSVIRIFSGRAKVEVGPSSSDPAVTEIREAGKKQLMAACLMHRGHLWVAPFENDGADPHNVLAAVKAGAGGLAAAEEYAAIASVRKDLGGLHLYISRNLFRRVSAGDPMQEKLAGFLGSLRADLDFNGEGATLDTTLKLSGPEISVLSGALRARNPVPDFTSLAGAGRHLVAKLSVNLPGLAKALGALSGQANTWAMLTGALDQLEQGSGIQARRGFLENLGDSYLVSVQIQPAELLVSASGGGGSPSIEKMLRAELYAQLKEPALFAETLDSLTSIPAAGQFVQKVAGKKSSRWKLGPGGMLTAAVEREFLVVATSDKQVDAALIRLADREKKASGWPESMTRKEHQVLVMDVKGLLKDLSQAQVPQSNFGAQMTRSMISMTTAKLASLGTATLDALLGQDALSVELRLTLR